MLSRGRAAARSFAAALLTSSASTPEGWTRRVTAGTVARATRNAEATMIGQLQQLQHHTTKAERAFRDLSADDALRALYIDFEGEKDHPPVLLGVHRRGRGPRPYVHAYFVDEAFDALGRTPLSLDAAIERVVRRAEARDRKIVA
jgi:hypothetical protein